LDVSGEKVLKLVNEPRFKQITELTENLLEVEMYKNVVCYKLPLHSNRVNGMCAYLNNFQHVWLFSVKQLAKLSQPSSAACDRFCSSISTHNDIMREIVEIQAGQCGM
jgi:hypothetical protein